jgi:hypothetical protein
MTINSVTIADTGLVVGDRLEGVTGQLGWSALRAQNPAYRPIPANLPLASRR